MNGWPPLPAFVRLREVGPRDGLQIEDPISTEAKVHLLEMLVRSGLKRIEATAFVSRSAVPAMADAEEIAVEVRRWPEVEWSALVAGAGGARRALQSGLTNLEYVVSAADGHSKANVGRTSRDSAALIAPIVSSCHEAGGIAEVIVATAWDCPFDGPTPTSRVIAIVDEAVRCNVDRVSIADTIGTTTPLRIASLVRAIQVRHSGLELGLHMHNTRGAGLAGVLTGMQLGVVLIDSSVGGLGGCPFAPGASGNVATEDVVYMCDDMGVQTGVDLGRIIEAAQIAQSTVGRRLDGAVLRAGDRLRN